MLRELAKRLPEEIPRAQILGPYSVTQDKVAGLGGRLLEDCRAAGFLDEPPPTWPELDVVDAWQWFGENAHSHPGQSFLVLIDLTKADQFDRRTIASLFSSARHLEGAWDQPGVRVFHMFAGYWDHPVLERYFQRVNTSFPYTVGYNYAIWQGLSADEIIDLVDQTRPEDAHFLHGRVLAELTGGHPAAVIDILNQIAPGDLRFSALLSSTYQAGASSPAGQALLDIWCRLPDESRFMMRDLVLQRHVPVSASQEQVERLRVAGVVRRDQLGATCYISFRSWYVELLVRLHTEELGIADSLPDTFYNRAQKPGF